ncbi:MAG: cytochrome c3 family protein [candidate division WOR-3 bacterium]
MKVKVFLNLFVLGLICIFLFSCAPEALSPTPSKVEPTLKEQKTQVKSLYEKEIAPLTLEECARCHFYVFNTIKNIGGKHQRECVFCHQQFHAYNPKRQNWDEIMPKCQNCHGLKHGSSYPNCFVCHSNPHAPKQEIKVTEAFAKECVNCHGKIKGELANFKSKHTNLECSFCHAEKHGNKPVCQDCHTPHVEKQTYQECLTCHKPHSPKNIPDFDPKTSNALCGSCHKAPYDKLSLTKSKHGNLTCSTCHTKHKYIPQCQSCHGEPHSPETHKKFTKCLQCHIDVHNLPTKGQSKK